MNKESREAKLKAAENIKRLLKIREKPEKLSTPKKMAENNISYSVDTLIQSLPTFDNPDEQNINFFLESFQQICEAAKIPENLKVILLKSKFTGSARQFLVNSPELRTETDYEKFKSNIIENFSFAVPFEDTQTEFTEAKQKVLESVDKYARKFNLASQKYLEKSGQAKKEGAIALLEKIKLTNFVNGLRPDIAFEVRKFSPSNFKEAVDVAKKIESAYSKSKELNTIDQQSCTTNSTLTELAKIQAQQISELTAQMNALSKNIQSTPEHNIPNIYCHICNKGNHATEHCFYNMKNQSNGFITPSVANRPNFMPRQSRNFWQSENYAQNFNDRMPRANFNPQRDFAGNQSQFQRRENYSYPNRQNFTRNTQTRNNTTYFNRNRNQPNLN